MVRRDPWLFVGLVAFCGVVLAGLFATVSALADGSRPRVLFRQTAG